MERKNLVNPMEDCYSWLTNSQVKVKNLVNPKKASQRMLFFYIGLRVFKSFDYYV